MTDGWLTATQHSARPLTGRQSLLLEDGNIEREMIQRQINSHDPVCTINTLPWNKELNWYSDFAACTNGILAEEGCAHQLLREKPHSGPQVKKVRGLSVVRASVSHAFKWMRRGYWLPINALRIMGRPCCTDTTICFRQNKSLAVGSLSLIHY